MSKRQKFENVEEVKISIAPLKLKGEGEVIDAYTPLPGQIKHLNSQPQSGKLKKRADQDEFTAYARLLVKHCGDAVKAVRDLYGLSDEEAAANVVAYREKLYAKGGATGLSALLESHDVGLPMQVAVLRDAMYGDSLPGRLKAVEYLREIEGKAGTKREGQRVEDLVRIAIASRAQEEAE